MAGKQRTQYPVLMADPREPTELVIQVLDPSGVVVLEMAVPTADIPTNMSSASLLSLTAFIRRSPEFVLGRMELSPWWDGGRE